MGKDNKTVDRIQAVWNIHGGEEGIDKLIQGETVVVSKSEYNAFLLNSGKTFITTEPKILKIPRSRPFESVTGFLGTEWTIAEQDERSLSLSEIDLTKVRFEDMLKTGEESVCGELRLSRLKKTEYICLDAKIFLKLWENKSMIPASWKEEIGGNTRYIYFDGTVLRGPRGLRCVLYIYGDKGGWGWGYDWLGNRSVSRYSAVLVV